MISTFPIGSTAVKVIVHDVPGTWDFGVSFEYGRGKLFNTYTRYYLRRIIDGKQTAAPALWSGWPTGAPDPLDASERRTVYYWIETAPARTRRWLERTIRERALMPNTLK